MSLQNRNRTADLHTLSIKRGQMPARVPREASLDNDSQTDATGGKVSQAGKTLWHAVIALFSMLVMNDWGTPRRMLKKTVQQGRSERRPEAYPLGYVEDLSDARTMLTGFFSIRYDR